MAMTTIAQNETLLVTVGVDTHLDTHTAVALDQLGRRLDVTEIAADRAGYEELLVWAASLGEIESFGIEGTNSYGAGLHRFLRGEGFTVLEATRPKRAVRRNRGKSDPIDAEAAARAVLAGEALGAPKAGNDHAEMIRVLRVARSTAVKARTQAINALRGVLVTAADELRDELRHLPRARLIARAARLRPGDNHSPLAATKETLRILARRYEQLTGEISALDAQLDELVAHAAPTLVAKFGFGTETAGQLVVTAGDNPHRLRSDAAFSMLCGASPKPAGSGKTSDRHRLNRSGDRQANAALHRVAIVRMRFHQPTRAYVERRTKEGKTKLEIIRCLKRYIAREAYTALITDLTPRHL
jgi:transposase